MYLLKLELEVLRLIDSHSLVVVIRRDERRLAALVEGLEWRERGLLIQSAFL